MLYTLIKSTWERWYELQPNINIHLFEESVIPFRAKALQALLLRLALLTVAFF